MAETAEQTETPDFHTDPGREDLFEDVGTGIYVRAIGQDNRWGTFDIAQLDRDSLVAFLRSRGPVSTWAVHTLLIVMGHDRDGVE